MYIGKPWVICVGRGRAWKLVQPLLRGHRVGLSRTHGPWSVRLRPLPWDIVVGAHRHSESHAHAVVRAWNTEGDTLHRYTDSDCRQIHRWGGGPGVPHHGGRFGLRWCVTQEKPLKPYGRIRVLLVRAQPPVARGCSVSVQVWSCGSRSRVPTGKSRNAGDHLWFRSCKHIRTWKDVVGFTYPCERVGSRQRAPMHRIQERTGTPIRNV